ncbi:hypothetical protein [Peribacillus frigoritolerans]|uniref:hypothetical protein n=1 Tax=Peribacillus frigoritolerans TaxID=450367 RepID=UPI002E2363B1|nr:hypothetical protein [Peribacillus frigoritolerans]
MDQQGTYIDYNVSEVREEGIKQSVGTLRIGRDEPNTISPQDVINKIKLDIKRINKRQSKELIGDTLLGHKAK